MPSKAPCFLFFLSVHVAITVSQILPSLPDISPSPSQTPSPSLTPTPSRTSTPSPSPTTDSGDDAGSTIPDAQLPVLSETTAIPTDPSASETTVLDPTPVVDTTAEPSLAPTPPSAASPIPLPIATPNAQTCVRDTNKVTPVPGRSAPRVALSVVATAAAVGVISVLYSLAADWRVDVPHTNMRLALILLARILTLAAVKVSAALVAAITSTGSDSSAFDASGAYLTWVSAISSRVYYEAIRMTTSAIEFGGRGGSAWDACLRDFVNRENQYYRIDTEDGQMDVPSSVYADITDPIAAEEHQSMVNSQDNSFLLDKSTFFRRVTCSTFVKTLLICSAALYIAHEIANLVLSLLNFIESLSNREEVSVFVDDGLGGQCGIRGADMGIILPVVFLQLLYMLFQQPSLIPILILGVFYPNANGQRNELHNPRKYRWIAFGVLTLWVSSLAVLPVFIAKLEPLLIVGDLSLFWYVIVAPPTYDSATYIVSIVYAVLAAGAGIVIIIRVSRSEANNVFKVPDGSQAGKR